MQVSLSCRFADGGRDGAEPVDVDVVFYGCNGGGTGARIWTGGIVYIDIRVYIYIYI